MTPFYPHPPPISLKCLALRQARAEVFSEDYVISLVLTLIRIRLWRFRFAILSISAAAFEPKNLVAGAFGPPW
jgi:hypothetical protein